MVSQTVVGVPILVRPPLLLVSGLDKKNGNMNNLKNKHNNPHMISVAGNITHPCCQQVFPSSAFLFKYKKILVMR